MDYSQKISERQWNIPDKGELESRREATYIDDIIQKDHIQRKLLEHLDGIQTVFDGGAGSGRFSFMPNELEGILLEYGVRNICLSGPGAYGRTIPREILVKIMKDSDQKTAFLDFCYRYDSNKYVCGMGKDNLLAIGDI